MLIIVRIRKINNFLEDQMKIIKKIFSQLILLIITLLILFALLLLPKDVKIERAEDGNYKSAEYIYSFNKAFRRK